MLEAAFEGHEHVAVLRLKDRTENGGELCFVTVGKRGYYGERIVDAEEGMVYVQVPELEKTYPYRIFNA